MNTSTCVLLESEQWVVSTKENSPVEKDVRLGRSGGEEGECDLLEIERRAVLKKASFPISMVSRQWRSIGYYKICE